MTDLGTVPGDSCSAAVSIKLKSQIVGNSGDCSANFPFIHAFLWEDGGPMVDLNTLAASRSGMQLTWAKDINDRGEIAGHAVLPNGDTHAVLLIPCNENHPGIKDCDYSRVEESATPATSGMPSAQMSTATTARLSPDAIRRFLQSAGPRSMPWRRGFGAQPQK